FRSRHREVASIDFLPDTALDDALRHELLFSGLPEVAHVDLDEFFQSGYLEIPLVGQLVSPTSRLEFCLQFLLHDLHDTLRRAAGVQVKVGAQVRPMIKRLDNDCLTAGILQCVHNYPKPFDST